MWNNLVFSFALYILYWYYHNYITIHQSKRKLNTGQIVPQVKLNYNTYMYQSNPLMKNSKADVEFKSLLKILFWHCIKFIYLTTDLQTGCCMEISCASQWMALFKNLSGLWWNSTFLNKGWLFNRTSLLRVKTSLIWILYLIEMIGCSTWTKICNNYDNHNQVFTANPTDLQHTQIFDIR